MTAQLHRLANGLAVAIEPMTGVETIALGLYVDVGSRHESEPLGGLAHLLEHMVFKGAGSRDARGIAEAVENVGGWLNAYTARDHTAFQARLLAEDVALGVGLIADLVRRPHLVDADLAREKQVVVQEMGEVQDTPDDVIYDHLHGVAFPGQSFGRPVLGQEASVMAVTPDDLRGWIARGYRPSSMVLAGAGKLDPAAFLALAEQHFGDLAPGRAEAAPAAVFAGGRFADTRSFEQTHVAIGHLGVGHHHDDHYPLSLFSGIVGEGSSSRLFQSVREERGLAYSVGSGASAWPDTGLFTAYFATARGDAARAAALVREVLREAAATIGEAELARGKAQARAGMLMSLESVQSRADRLGLQVLLHGRVIPPAETIAAIEACTVERVRAAAARMLASPEAVATVGGKLAKAA